MIYSANITTLANTAEVDRIETVLQVARGLVYKVEIAFPPGSAGLLGVQIHDVGHQIYPTSPGEYFIGDAILIEFEDVYLKTIKPNEFTIYTYNTDTLYPHSCQVRIGLCSEEIFMARYLPSYTYKYFQEMLQQLEATQLSERLARLSEGVSPTAEKLTV